MAAFPPRPILEARISVLRDDIFPLVKELLPNLNVFLLREGTKDNDSAGTNNIAKSGESESENGSNSAKIYDTESMGIAKELAKELAIEHAAVIANQGPNCPPERCFLFLKFGEGNNMLLIYYFGIIV